jgi:hypothetical protein
VIKLTSAEPAERRQEQHQSSKSIGRDGPRSRANGISDKADLIAFQDKTRQSSGCVGTRIDVDTVGPNIRFQDGSVSMHDNFAKVVLAQEEILSNPEEVVFGLLGEANSWSNSCMYEEEITADEILLQAAQELAMARWKNSVKFRREFSLLLGVGFDRRD